MKYTYKKINNTYVIVADEKVIETDCKNSQECLIFIEILLKADKINSQKEPVRARLYRYR